MIEHSGHVHRRRTPRQRGWSAASCLAWVLLAPWTASRSPAEIAPSAGAADGRIRTAVYDADQVYRLRGFVGYQIDIEFAPGESFIGLGAGDIEALGFVAQDNHLFLKPRAEQVATNLTVLTNRHPYQFDYTAVSQHPAASEPDVVYALRFIYPPTASQVAAEVEAQHIAADLGGARTDIPRNVDYWYCGGPQLRPIRASDDGVHTRLRFAANAELPAIFVRGADGESLVNFSMEDGDVIIHRVAQRLVLRRGASTGCIVNKAFRGGLRLESGTVSPAVERRVPGALP